MYYHKTHWLRPAVDISHWIIAGANVKESSGSGDKLSKSGKLSAKISGSFEISESVECRVDELDCEAIFQDFEDLFYKLKDFFEYDAIIVVRLLAVEVTDWLNSVRTE